MGRKPIFAKVITPAERQRRHREKFREFGPRFEPPRRTGLKRRFLASFRVVFPAIRKPKPQKFAVFNPCEPITPPT